MATKKTEPQSNTSSLVLDFLQASPGREFSPKEIADALQLVPVRVSAALQYLSRQHPEIKNETRGQWSWREHITRKGALEMMTQTPEGDMAVQPAAAILVAPVGLPDSMASVFVPITTHRSGATVLRDANGDLWLAQPIPITMWPVLGAMGFEEPDDAKAREREARKRRA